MRRLRQTTMGEQKNKRWWDDGLYFSCLGCGKCCGGEPGFIWLDLKEAQKIAEFLGIEAPFFLATYTHKKLGRISIKEKENGDCQFLAWGKCEIYPVRPLQCRLYPFWPSILSSPRGWSWEGRRCPGIGQGRFYPAKIIDRMLVKALPLGL